MPKRNIQPEPRPDWTKYATPLRFRFEVLGNAVFETGTTLGEVLYLADDVFASEPREQRTALAKEAVELLLRDGLVELEALDDRDADQDELLSDAQAVLASDDRAAGALIGLWPTSEGVALAESPPDEIRRLWGMA